MNNDPSEENTDSFSKSLEDTRLPSFGEDIHLRNALGPKAYPKVVLYLYKQRPHADRRVVESDIPEMMSKLVGVLSARIVEFETWSKSAHAEFHQVEAQRDEAILDTIRLKRLLGMR